MFYIIYRITCISPQKLIRKSTIIHDKLLINISNPRQRRQKLQMYAPMIFSTQLAQEESVWDDEITFSENDKVTFELCHKEHEELITEEIEEVSKT